MAGARFLRPRPTLPEARDLTPLPPWGESCQSQAQNDTREIKTAPQREGRRAPGDVSKGQQDFTSSGSPGQIPLPGGGTGESQVNDGALGGEAAIQ